MKYKTILILFAVISWLNKQITETQLSGQQRHGPFEMNSTVSSVGSARPALVSTLDRDTSNVRKSVIESNIHIEVNTF